MYLNFVAIDGVIKNQLQENDSLFPDFSPSENIRGLQHYQEKLVSL
jgi:hypothetical protein